MSSGSKKFAKHVLCTRYSTAASRFIAKRIFRNPQNIAPTRSMQACHVVETHRSPHTPAPCVRHSSWYVVAAALHVCPPRREEDETRPRTAISERHHFGGGKLDANLHRTQVRPTPVASPRATTTTEISSIPAGRSDSADGPASTSLLLAALFHASGSAQIRKPSYHMHPCAFLSGRNAVCAWSTYLSSSVPPSPRLLRR